jgi:hypothetical protein
MLITDQFQLGNSSIIFLKYFKQRLRSALVWQAAKRKPWIFSRTACLGNDALLLSHESESKVLINLQKGRADLLRESFVSNKRGSLRQAHKYISRSDILNLVWQQSHRPISALPAPEFILFDSFSDLTDRCFTLPNGEVIYCHKTDLLQIQKSKGLVDNGLLEIANIREIYNELFQIFRSTWGEVKIIFIHFPTKLEKRQKYLLRSDLILNAVNELVSTTTFLYSIDVPNHLVEPEIDSMGQPSVFPYHYSQATKLFVSEEISKILAV